MALNWSAGWGLRLIRNSDELIAILSTDFTESTKLTTALLCVGRLRRWFGVRCWRLCGFGMLG